MVQCEMCGADTSTPKTIKVEGAELDVCGDCADFGTEVETQQTSTTSTKYSTSSNSSNSSSSSSGNSGTSSARRRSDMFDQMDEIAQDYDTRIRNAREQTSLSQEELADKLNEKASLIRKLERGDVLPSDGIQSKLESELGISLSGSAAPDDAEWESDSSSGEYTLGDVVKRKDS